MISLLSCEPWVEKASITGLSLGAAVGMWLSAKYPDKVKSLSLHSAWTKTDPFLKTVVEGWQVMAKALGNVPEMVILSIFPWCFTPELYAAKPDYIESLADLFEPGQRNLWLRSCSSRMQ